MYTLGCQIRNPQIYLFQILMKLNPRSVFIIPHRYAAMAAYITGQVMYADQFLYTLIIFFLTANNVQYNVNMMFQPVSFMTRQVFLQPKLEIV